MSKGKTRRRQLAEEDDKDKDYQIISDDEDDNDDKDDDDYNDDDSDSASDDNEHEYVESLSLSSSSSSSSSPSATYRPKMRRQSSLISQQQQQQRLHQLVQRFHGSEKLLLLGDAHSLFESFRAMTPSSSSKSVNKNRLSSSSSSSSSSTVDNNDLTIENERNNIHFKQLYNSGVARKRGVTNYVLPYMSLNQQQYALDGNSRRKHKNSMSTTIRNKTLVTRGVLSSTGRNRYNVGGDDDDDDGQEDEDAREEKELIYDAYFEMGMAKRSLARTRSTTSSTKKRKRDVGGDDDSSDVIENHYSEELIKNLQFNSPLTNTPSMKTVLETQCHSAQHVAMDEKTAQTQCEMYDSWNKVWNETNTYAKKPGYKTSSNIIVAGYGSKLQLLNRFVHSYLLKDQTCFVYVLAGYDPTVSIRSLILQILSSLDTNAMTTKYDTDNDIVNRIHKNLYERVIKGSELTNETVKQPSFFLRSLHPNFTSHHVPTQTEVYICIHNIESAQLQSGQSQKTLALLCSHPQIHLIASIDHPMSCVIWDSATYSLFNFQYFWIDDTKRPYVNESMFINKFTDNVRVAVSQSKENVIKGLESILKSFGHQPVKTFQTLVSMIHSGKETETRGFSLEDICSQLESTSRSFVNQKTIRDHLIKLQGNDLIVSEIVRGKSLFCLTRHYHKFLDAVHDLCVAYGRSN